jgi:polyisoprenoid-binding protein YceI
MRHAWLMAGLVAIVAASWPAAVAAQTISFTLLPRSSSATFKSDAPLETIVGHTADAGLQGQLSVDPARPQMARGTVKIDMNTVHTGIEERDHDMRAKYLQTDVAANRWVTFEVMSAEVAGPLQPGQPVKAKIRGLLTVKQKSVERIADGTVTYITLSPEQVEAQKRFGLSSDNIKVRAGLATTFADHAMQVPQLLILKLSNDIAIETDLTFVKP